MSDVLDKLAEIPLLRNQVRTLKHELDQVRTASRQHKERKEFLEQHCDRQDDRIDRLKDKIQELEQQL